MRNAERTAGRATNCAKRVDPTCDMQKEIIIAINLPPTYMVCFWCLGMRKIRCLGNLSFQSF